MGTPALIALGSNLGDRRAHLDAAVAALSETPGVAVVAVSPYHGTDPVGGPSGQGSFLNAAALLDCSIDPFALHARLQAVEAAEGRVRSIRWGVRTLDLDLILFGDRVIDTPTLTVPHLRMAVRRFVLAPASSVAAELVDPLTGRSVADLLANLDRRPSVLGLGASFRPLERAYPRLRDRIESAIGPGRSEGGDPDAWRIAAGEHDAPAPMTFEALAGPEARAPLALPTSLPTHPRLRLRLPDGATVPDALIAEIAAACAAARSG
jgi:2-amino-4-hydroxy-6-hydroxymethyldihydropteridine diphosphokinase